MKYRAIFAVVLAAVIGTACSEPDRPSIPLYLAVQRGDLDQLERHIFWQTDINAMLPNGQYPLHVAADKGRFVMVKTLLKHGAAIDQSSQQGDSPLDLAILGGRTQVAELLLAQGAQLDPSGLLLKAAAAGTTDRDVIRFLISRGADTEQRDSSGDTPLLIAIRQDNHRLATHLVNQGADINVTDRAGQSALSLARQLQFPELIRLLERVGAR